MGAKAREMVDWGRWWMWSGREYPSLAEHEVAEVVAADRQRGGDRAAAEEDIDKNNISKKYIYLFLLLSVLEVPLLLISSSTARGRLVDGEDGLSALENNNMM